MISRLHEKHVRNFDYSKFDESFWDQWRENVVRLGGESDIETEPIGTRNVRKADRVMANSAQRGEQPGLVCIVSGTGTQLELHTRAQPADG